MQKQQPVNFSKPKPKLQPKNKKLPPALQETEFPTTDQPIQFFKTYERMTQDVLSVRMGIRVLEFNKVQDDYICYLVQLLMTQCSFLKVFIIQPNFLYFQINTISQQVSSNQSQSTQHVQRQIIDMLRQSSQIFNEFARQHLSGSSMMSQSFNQEQFIGTFQQTVIQRLNSKFQQIFNDKSK